MTSSVYIDGQAGTTGLRIRDWLRDRRDIEVIMVEESRRKEDAARRECIMDADLAVFCLPDAAAREAAGWVGNHSTKLLDASTAHRVDPAWTYGLAELDADQRDKIRNASRVSNPGCYPTGFVLLLRPLIDAGLIDAGAALSIHALSGYTGGGRGLIERWQDDSLGLGELPYEAPYALDRVHKHIPEMIAYSGLEQEPYFVPAVGPFACGMRVQVPLNVALIGVKQDQGVRIREVLETRYNGEACVRVVNHGHDSTVDEWTLDPLSCNDTNRIDLHVHAHPSGHVLLSAVLDNLGKGASGAAIQNLNLMLGLDEMAGLTI
jgi:N-acetyl-gamma-glutamyl-phosphate reductase